MFKHLMALAVAAPAFTQDCPPQFNPFQIERQIVGDLMLHEGGVIRDHHQISTRYWDNRHRVSYAYDIEGETTLYNFRDVTWFVRHRMEIPGHYMPALPVIESSDICFDESTGNWIILVQRELDPGESEVVEWSAYILFEDRSGGADLNEDFRVDGRDLGLFMQYWNTQDLRADLNGDGFVSAADQGILLMRWTDDSQ